MVREDLESVVGDAPEYFLTRFEKFCLTMIRGRVDHIVATLTTLVTNALESLKEAHDEVQKLGLNKAVDADLTSQAARSSLQEIAQHSSATEFFMACKVLNTWFKFHKLVRAMEKHVTDGTWTNYTEACTSLQEVMPKYLSTKAASLQ